MTRQEKNYRLNKGLTCPLCGLHLMDLEHDGYNGDDENYHEYYCTDCNITFNVSVDDSDSEHQFKVGDKVIWHDPSMSYYGIEYMLKQANTLYEIVKVNGNYVTIRAIGHTAEDEVNARELDLISSSNKFSISELYDKVTKCFLAEEPVLSTIHVACDVLEDKEEFKDLHAKCVAHVNRWSADTFDEWVAEGEELIEELSGTLGEYLA